MQIVGVAVYAVVYVLLVAWLLTVNLHRPAYAKVSPFLIIFSMLGWPFIFFMFLFSRHSHVE